jgi:hypothetical protein
MAGSIPLFLLGVMIYLFFATAIGIFLGAVARSTPQLGLLYMLLHRDRGSFVPRCTHASATVWSAWCAKRNVSALPAEPTAVVVFVDAQAEIKSPATVRRYIATIAHMHRAAELSRRPIP